MNLSDIITITLTRAEFLTVADALIMRRREGEQRQKTATTKLALGIGMQMAEDADQVLTKLSLQELTQATPADPIREIVHLYAVGSELHRIKPLDRTNTLVAQDAALAGTQCLAALEKR
jgi:hypothetical protein